jgi:hypothetical protein
MPGISAASDEEDPRSMPGISATSEEEDPGSMPGICNGASAKDGGGPGSMPRISGASEEEDPRIHAWDLRHVWGGGPGIHAWITATSEEEDPGSMPRLCNGATTTEGGGPGFYTQDLQPAEVSGEERDIFK